MAFALFASVRSTAGRRSGAPSVGAALASYTDHASYMQVCAIASARAVGGGPNLPATGVTSVSAAQFQSVTTVCEATVSGGQTVAEAQAANQSPAARIVDLAS